jgi:RNA-directed DNA polymerase
LLSFCVSPLRGAQAVKRLSSRQTTRRQPEYGWFVCESEHERQLLVVRGVFHQCVEPESEFGADGREPERQQSGLRFLCPLPQGLDCFILEYMGLNSEQLVCDLFRAYYDARRNKRSTLSALAFEVDYERNLFELFQEIIERRYEVSPSFCFVSKKPVLREVFAADFRDRVVHHLIYNAVSPIFERRFIHDSYSCRTSKGTSYGIRRVEHFLRSCSRNYQRDCYILKLDISGYFMSIDRSLLYAKVEQDILRYKQAAEFDVDLLLHLIRKIVFHDPTAGCTIKGDRRNWVGLPKSKSLFWVEPNRGLPIGNLTSQLFGNVYLNEFDHFVKCRLGCRYYGRCVDDFIIIHPDKEHLKAIIPVITAYLEEKLYLQLHRKKIYLQHVSKGVLWLGMFIKPHRKYIRNRTKGNFYAAIRHWNGVIERERERERELRPRPLIGLLPA